MEERIDYLIKHKLKNLMIKAQSKNRYQPKPFMGAQAAIAIAPKENSLL